MAAEGFRDVSALTFFLADALSRRVSASVHGRVTSPSPSARARPGGNLRVSFAVFFPKVLSVTVSEPFWQRCLFR